MSLVCFVTQVLSTLSLSPLSIVPVVLPAEKGKYFTTSSRARENSQLKKWAAALSRVAYFGEGIARSQGHHYARRLKHRIERKVRTREAHQRATSGL